MIKKTIKYVDYNGNEREEDFFFHLSKAEITEMELSVDGGYTAMITRIIAAQNAPEIIKIFKELILKSYGIKSPDGKEFEKSEEISNKFSHTEAYSELFMQLATDEEAAAAFVNGIMPQDLVKEVQKSEFKDGIEKLTK